MSNTLFKPLNWLFAKLSKKIKSVQALRNSQQSNPKQLPAEKNSISDLICCDNIVHVAYRAVSDDRLNIAYDRKWQEVKFFRPRGLRVFCKTCRRRLH